MPKSCVAMNCTNHNLKHGQDGVKISFHVFPNDQEKANGSKLLKGLMRIKADGALRSMPFYVANILLEVNICIVNVYMFIMFLSYMVSLAHYI